VQQARHLGISEVSVSSWCSAHHHDRFFSHRASRGSAGRMAAYLGRPLA
jgi:copper oxidase (laccase) domain-containing protein